MRRLAAIVAVALSSLAAPTLADGLPADFVRLRDIDASIRQDMRYVGAHNFVGRPIDGYVNGECWLTRPAALALKGVQDDLRPLGLGLVVFECYRPQRAVDHFVRWARDVNDTVTRAEFYPGVDKRDLFRLGYIAKRSGHSRGSTVDVTLTGPGALPAQSYRPGQPLVACTAPYGLRFADGGLDLGTGYDCFDPLSHPASTEVTATAQANRKLLAEAMAARGFGGIPEEYWHFTYRPEPYPDSYFDVPVE